MRNEKLLNVSDVHTHTTDARKRVNGAHRMSTPWHAPKKPDWPYPILEKVFMAVKDYPYAALGVMIGIASIVIAAVTVLAVSIIGGMFLMYGEMRQNTALMGDILKKQQTIETRQLDDGKVMRAYEAANGKRIEFMVGLMSPVQRREMNEYDRAHPNNGMPREEKEQ